MTVPPGVNAGDPGESGWWRRMLPRGGRLGLIVYGDQMNGRVEEFSPHAVGIRVPLAEQPRALQLSTATGIAEVPLGSGVLNVPVRVAAESELLRLRAIGAGEYIERRVHPRVAIELPVTVAWKDADVGAWTRVVSRTVDLSMGGLLVEPVATVWPSPGTDVLVSVVFPDGAAQTHASVIGKTADYGLRLQFHDLAATVAARIGALVPRVP